MAVKIGHASGDERGKISGGKAGDQTGKEVCSRNWYKHSKGWYTAIPTDPEMLEYIATAAERAVANNDIGYDQSQNRTLWNNVKDKGYDPAKTTKAVETDCAELGALCAQYALEKTGKNVVVADSYSASLINNLVKTGYFKKLTADKYTNQDSYLLRGMIQATRTKGHVWIILSNGSKASLKEFYGNNVTVTEKPLTFGDRTLRNGSEGEDVAQLQSYLIQLGYDCGSWGADGDFGDATEIAVKEFQTDNKLEVDGIVGPMTYAALEAALRDKVVIEPKKVKIINGNCYVRTKPNTSGSIINTAHKNETYTYLNEKSEDGWHKIDFNGKEGWVSGKYSELI